MVRPRRPATPSSLGAPALFLCSCLLRSRLSSGTWRPLSRRKSRRSEGPTKKTASSASSPSGRRGNESRPPPLQQIVLLTQIMPMPRLVLMPPLLPLLVAKRTAGVSRRRRRRPARRIRNCKRCTRTTLGTSGGGRSGREIRGRGKRAGSDDDGGAVCAHLP